MLEPGYASMWGSVLVAAVCLSAGYMLIDQFDPVESVAGKRVVITGASAGIGEQLAYHYARLGAKILVTSRRESALKQVISKCQEVGSKDGEYFYVAADMSDMASTEHVIKSAVSQMGGIDILVLNHIIVTPLGEWMGSAENFTTLQRILDVNTKAYIHLASHALPYLQQSNGSIVVVSSVAGKVAQPYTIAYSASKFALDGFFSGLRQEFRIKNIDVSITLCVIGLIGTENSLTQMKNFGLHFLLNKLKPALPADAAYAILRGGAMRQREMYFPFWKGRLFTLLRDWIPNLLEAFNRYFYYK